MIGTFFCLVLCGNAAGAAIEKLENIRTAVRDYAIAEVGTEADGVHIEVGRLDPRLRLAACSHPLDTYFSPGARNIGHTTVGVRCDVHEAPSRSTTCREATPSAPPTSTTRSAASPA